MSAGSGKSTISTPLQIASSFTATGSLSVLDRDVTERSDPAKVAPTLAYQLELFYPDIGDLITGCHRQQSSNSHPFYAFPIPGASRRSPLQH